MQGKLDQAEDRLREQVRLVESHAAEARTDALTLVGNRRAFEADMAQCLADFQRTGQVFTLAMIDLDKFKRLNDTYGHQAGDEVLRGTGRVLRRVLPESDMIARYGGEEFAVIFKRSTVGDVHRALTRLRKAIQKTEFQGPSGKFEVTISIGAAISSGSETLESIFERADAALYSSKEAGRNCAHWNDGQTIALIEDEENKPAPAPAPPKAIEPPKAVEPPAQAPIGAESASDNGNSLKLADDLPELLNRTAFCQLVRTRVAEWKRGGPTLSLVLVEIDNFESLTRTYGPKCRDLMLTTLARAIFAGVREMDTVARYSPSCFGFLLPKASIAGRRFAWPVGIREFGPAGGGEPESRRRHAGLHRERGLDRSRPGRRHGHAHPQGGDRSRCRPWPRRQLHLLPRRRPALPGRRGEESASRKSESKNVSPKKPQREENLPVRLPSRVGLIFPAEKACRTPCSLFLPRFGYNALASTFLKRGARP